MPRKGLGKRPKLANPNLLPKKVKSGGEMGIPQVAPDKRREVMRHNEDMYARDLIEKQLAAIRPRSLVDERSENFREADEAQLLETAYRARLLGMTMEEISAHTGVSVNKLQRVLNIVTERVLAEVDDWKRTFIATNIQRLETIIRIGMGQIVDAETGQRKMPSRDTTSAIFQAIRLEKELFDFGTPPPNTQINNTAIQINNTLSTKSPVYEHALTKVHGDHLQHTYPEQHVAQHALINDERYKRLENLVGIDELEAVEAEDVQGSADSQGRS